MEKNDETEYILPDDRWLQSHYTYLGDVFDSPEHKDALSKLKTIEEQNAYKDKKQNHHLHILLSFQPLYKIRLHIQ